jgi:hypothetical protein
MTSAVANPGDQATCGETQLEQAAVVPMPPPEAPAKDGPGPAAIAAPGNPAEGAGPVPAPLALLGSGRPARCKAPGSCARASYGTSVEFVDNPPAATQRALGEKKLLFVLHVAGNFEDDRFT